MSPFTPGRKLLDRYLLEQCVGVGGMSEVWRAVDLVLGRSVAVKALAGPVARDATLRAGTRREARSVAQLSHPNITAVHDYGEVALPDGGTEPFLVMELLTGEALDDRLARAPMTWQEAAHIGARVASALAAAHQQGVVHRDIKPGNIMLTPTAVKVLDFGIAATTGQPDPAGGWLIGTPAYAAPERLHRAPIDPAADVYALGVMLFQMVTGAKPLAIDDWQQAAAVHAQPRPQLTVRAPAGAPLVPAALASLIMRAMSAEPGHRPSSAEAARTLADPLLGSTAAAQVTAQLPATPPAPDTGARPTSGGPTARASAAVPSPPTQVYQQAQVHRPALVHRTGQGAAVRTPRRRRSRGALGAAALMAVLLIAGISIIVSNARLAAETGTPSSLPTAAPVVSTKPARPASRPAPTLSPSPKTPTTVSGMVSDLQDLIAGALASGDLTTLQALDLGNRLRDIAGRWQDEEWKDVVRKSEDLRDRIENKVDDKEIDKEVGDQFDRLLKRITERARENQKGD